MCRYGQYGPYKEKWACFACRKSFKKTNISSYERLFLGANAQWRKFNCPQCSRPMNNMGFDFKAPSQADMEQWQKVGMLFAHGYTFSSCGCCGPGPRPAGLREVPEFLQEQERLANEHRRLSNIRERAAELKTRRKKKRRQFEDKRVEKLLRLAVDK
jgi:hypothetical protein